MNPKTFVLTFLLVLAPAAIAEACPMCKDSVPNSTADAPAGVPGGFNVSIYYMLAGLFTVGGLVIGMIVKSVRATDASHAATLARHQAGERRSRGPQ